MIIYIHQLPDWPQFRWRLEELADRLASVSRHQGRLIGSMEKLGLRQRTEATLANLTEEVLKSSEIEGEVLDREQVRSSLARRLGLDAGGLKPADRNVEGIVEVMLDATQRFDAPLTADRLFNWHAALFPTGRSGMSKIVVGAWRTEASGPMQIVSGPYGKEKVHYEAPGHDRLAQDMDAFLRWFNAEPTTDPVLKAAIAHLWLVTIHPFDDGNGRIARAIADMALARSENTAQRFYSMSAQIRIERKAYYDILEATQKGDLDITRWLSWFLACLDRAFDGAEGIFDNVMRKTRFWDGIADQEINERQRKVLNRLLDGFEGALTSSKWATLTKASQDTASRDIADLVARGVLARNPGGGRSTSYTLIVTPGDALHVLADHVRADAGYFVRDGAALLSEADRQRRVEQIEAIAAGLDGLAETADENDSQAVFEEMLARLHALGFFPGNQLVGAIAGVFHRSGNRHVQ